MSSQANRSIRRWRVNWTKNWGSCQCNGLPSRKSTLLSRRCGSTCSLSRSGKHRLFFAATSIASCAGLMPSLLASYRVWRLKPTMPCSASLAAGAEQFLPVPGRNSKWGRCRHQPHATPSVLPVELGDRRSGVVLDNSAAVMRSGHLACHRTVSVPAS